MSKHPPIASDVEAYRREWGIPNWEDEKSYGKVTTWSRERWFWEFQRRRPCIREYFDSRADAEYQQLLSLYQISPESFVDSEPPRKPHDAGFGIEVAEEDREQVGFWFLPNPRIPDHPDLEVWSPIRSSRVRFAEPPRNGRDLKKQLFLLGNALSKEQKIGERLFAAGVILSKEQRYHLKDILDCYPGKLNSNEAMWVHNLDLPMAPQFERFKSILESEYKARKKLVQHRPRPKKWLSYMRVLDGRREGASWSKLSKALPDSMQQTAHAARDTFDAASSLRFIF